MGFWWDLTNDRGRKKKKKTRFPQCNPIWSEVWDTFLFYLHLGEETVHTSDYTPILKQKDPIYNQLPKKE